MDNASFKVCPFCKEEIRKTAVKCRFCGEWLEPGHEPKMNPSSEEQPEPSTPINTSGSSTEVLHEEKVELRERPFQLPRLSVFVTNQALTPLFLITVLIFCYAMPLAIKNGATGFWQTIIYTIVYCTTPESVILLAAMAVWFWIARIKTRSKQSATENSKTIVPIMWPVIIAGLVLVAAAIITNYSAVKKRNAQQRQILIANDVDLDAFKDWEIRNKSSQLGNEFGLTPSAKKRLRETFALQLRGTFSGLTNFVVELYGEDHDKLIIKCRNLDPIAANWREALQEVDTNFWNRMIFSDFNEIVFVGTNKSISIPKTKFKDWVDLTPERWT